VTSEPEEPVVETTTETASPLVAEEAEDGVEDLDLSGSPPVAKGGEDGVEDLDLSGSHGPDGTTGADRAARR
jgi:hypothetical protein